MLPLGKNIRAAFGSVFGQDIVANLLIVFEQIDAYKTLQPRADHGEQAEATQESARPATKGGRPLSQRELEELFL